MRIIILFSFCLIFSCKNKESKTQVSEIKTVEVPKAMSLKQAWTTDTTLITPESVLFDEKYGVYYVSCIGAVPPDAKDKDGYIAKVDQRGNIISPKWITGMSAPKGMALKGDTLYVTNIDEILMIHTLANKIIKRIPVKGAKFLNDIAINQKGIIYISDSNTNITHSYDGKMVTSFLQNEALGGPNGIYCEADHLVMASFGKGQVYTVNLSNPAVEVKVDTLPGGDGVEAYNGGYLISNWNGEVYFINKDWKKQLLLDTKAEKRNAADIEVVATQNLLLVPEFFGNKVTAYTIEK